MSPFKGIFKSVFGRIPAGFPRRLACSITGGVGLSLADGPPSAGLAQAPTNPIPCAEDGQKWLLKEEIYSLGVINS